MSSNEAIQLTGDVVSTKPKWDRHDKSMLSIVVKADSKPYWFKWGSDRGKLSVGDTVELTAVVDGQGETTRKGQVPMTFLRHVQLTGFTNCIHAVVATQDGEYFCDACGEPMVVAATKMLESPE